MGGEAHHTHFHFENGTPDELPEEPDPGSKPPGGVGVWGLLLHMVLMVPLIPATIADVLVTIVTVVALVRALASPSFSVVMTSGAAATPAVLVAAFLVAMVVGLGLLTWVLVLLARTILDRRHWRFVLFVSLGLLVVGVSVWAFGGAGLLATASVFAVFGYVALLALGHILWARRHADDRSPVAER